MRTRADCIPNIGPRERRQRLRIGLAALAVGVVLAAVLVAAGADTIWRLTVFVPFWLAGIGIFQYRDRT